MTPQIITETVWALACNPKNQDQWIPDEIHVMSTLDGLTQIRSRLFSDQIFDQFKTSYPVTVNIQFEDRHLHVIKNEQNLALADLKTPEDNEHAANAICEMIRDFTSQDHVTLHVSIAGGRKTMGFYAGYALSLYGRAQDRMSHVLVEEKFETARDFFYPTLNSSFVTDRFGKEWDAKDAQVWLAGIPFVRLKDAVKNKHQLKSNDSFSDVVNKINESFNDVKLTLDIDNRKVIVNDKFLISDLPPREFTMLHWFADLRQKGKDGIIAPTKKINSKDIQPSEAKYIAQLSEQFKQYYEEFKNTADIQLDVDKQFFESVKSLLNTALLGHLGLELAEKVSLTQSKKGQPFYLNIKPENIEIIHRI